MDINSLCLGIIALAVILEIVVNILKFIQNMKILEDDDMSQEMRTIPVPDDVKNIENLVMDVGNVHIEFKNGMFIYDKAATKILVNGVEVLNVPKRSRIARTSDKAVDPQEFEDSAPLDGSKKKK